MAESTYTQTYNSFSGVDMHVTFGDRVIGELQGISYTVTREKAPLYTMGSADPRSFSRGKRGIAGSLTFLVLDRSAILEEMKRQGRLYVANRYELFQTQVYTDIEGSRTTAVGGNVGSALVSNVQVPGLNSEGNIITSEKVLAEPNYHDQCPPFNIVVTAANEYGHMASMSIYGVEILNAGAGMSIDDITIDEACTFVATSLKPWNSQMHLNIRTNQLSQPRYAPGFSGGRGGAI